MPKKGETKISKTKMSLVETRSNYKLHLIENPNYFGSISPIDIVKPPKIISKLLLNTSYEELTCVGFNPDTNELNAVVLVKKNAGYGGGPCSDGTKEYVRFYLDYSGSDAWIDAGTVNFNTHDLQLGATLAYDVKIKIAPDVQHCCDDPVVLPKVRAILSWNHEPPAAQPNWLPTWGNRLEAFIQIHPYTGILCWLKDHMIDVKPNINDVLKKLPPELIEKNKELFKPNTTLVPKKEISLIELKKQYKNKVEDARIAHKTVSSLLLKPNIVSYNKYTSILSEAKLDVSKLTDFIIKSKFNTSYEELACVGLNRDLNTLVSNVKIKKKIGYSGDLCTSGSREYVAFYIDFGSGWEYQGTSSVNVHDIDTVPAEGLWYAVEMPVALDAHRKTWCQTGKAKVKAILSWNTPPTPNDPNYVAPWGDWEECTIEIKPLPKDVPNVTDPIPFIESLGGMPVSLIDSTTGLANGSNGSGLTGNDSPFDGMILVNGVILNAPDSYGPQMNLKYRAMAKGPNDAGFSPYLRAFWIYVTTYTGGIPVGPTATKQTPDADGFVDYIPDWIPPNMKSVDRSKLQEYYPAESGLHELYIEVYDPNTGDYYLSNKITFMVDKTGPIVDVNITSGAGNCGVFGDNEIMAGTFSISGDYLDYVTLCVTPSAAAHGTAPVIDGMGDNTLNYGVDLPDSGFSGTWQLDTDPMDPCGYNIWVHGEDRTIVDSGNRGHESWKPQGFCVMADEEKGV